MKKPIKTAVVGLGRSGWGLCELLANERFDGAYELTAACDIISERVEEFVETYKGKGYDNIDALLDDPDVELVIIATRSIDHFEHAMKVLKAGKNVVVEKPASINFGKGASGLCVTKRYTQAICTSEQTF